MYVIGAVYHGMSREYSCLKAVIIPGNYVMSFMRKLDRFLLDVSTGNKSTAQVMEKSSGVGAISKG